MRRALAACLLALAGSAVVPAATASEIAVAPVCRADRLYVVYEASEGFLLSGVTEHHPSLWSTIRCDIVRFGTDVVASIGNTCPGSACADAAVVSTPYGGMQVCTYAEHELVGGGTWTYGPRCSPIGPPS